MSKITATNRIIDPRKEYYNCIKSAVASYEGKKEYKKNNKRGFQGIWNLSKCSQCQRGMRKDIAEIQIENKRENAPICQACIMGYTRKDKVKIFKDWKPENIKKFKDLKNEKH